MKRALFFIFLMGLVQPIFSAPSSAQEQFNQANQLYEKGDVDKAGEIYNALYNQGYGSAALYYNLGNVAYRKGDRGKAVLWFERAKRIAPRDTDIQFNLSLARSHLKDTSPQWLRNFIFYLNGNELAVISSVLLWIFLTLFGAMTLGWVKLEIWPGMTLWTTGLLLVMFGSWLGAHVIWDSKKTGVVTTAPGEVRNGPGTDYAVGFTVPEGSEVLVLNERPEWTQIGVVNQGLKGWIPASEIELINVPMSLH